MKINIYPKHLNGIITAPPSKSLTHRAIICASLCKEPSTIYNPMICNDTLKTINALELLGVTFKISSDSIKVTPPKKFKYIADKVICKDSSSTLRLLVPLLTFLQDGVTFECDQRLTDRVLDDDFENFSFNFLKTQNTLTFSKLSILNEVELSSKNSTLAISGYLLSAPIFNQDTSLIIKATKLDHNIEMTLDVMAAYGIEYTITKLNNEIIIKINKQIYQSKDFNVEGDYFLSSNYLVAGLLNNNIRINNLSKNSMQSEKTLIELLTKHNAHFTISNNYVISNKSNIHPLNVDLFNISELGPCLIALSSLIPGKNKFTNLQMLVEKDHNKLEQTIDILCQLGAEATLVDNYLTIEGKDILEGGVEINVYNDLQLLLMVLAISAMFKKPVVINNCDKVINSYPEVWNQFKALGGEFAIIQ